MYIFVRACCWGGASDYLGLYILTNVDDNRDRVQRHKLLISLYLHVLPLGSAPNVFSHSRIGRRRQLRGNFETISDAVGTYVQNGMKIYNIHLASYPDFK